MADITDSLSVSIHALEEKIHTLQIENARCSEATDEKIKLLTQAVDKAADAFLLIDETGRFIDMNQQACRSLGYSREEMLGMGVADIDVSMSREGFQKIYHAIVKYGAISIEGVHQRKDGSQFPVEQSISCSSIDGRHRMFSLVRDISERQHHEQILQHSEAKYRNLIDSAHDAIVGADSSWKIVIWNKQAEQLFGYSQVEAVGQSIKMIVPEYLELFHEQVSISCTSSITPQQHLRLSGRHKDGHAIPIEINLSMFKDAEGQIIFTAIFRDLTAHDQLEREYRQAQKMEGIGTLVGGIAHDFNNMLAGMMGNLYLLSRDTSLSATGQKRVTLVNDLCDRATAMISQLLTFARKDVVQMESLPFARFLEKALELARLSIPENIQFVQNIECDACERIFADSTQLQQLLLNLLVNARDAIQDVAKPRIRIELQRVECSANLHAIHPALAQGPWLKLSVIDNGCGVPASIQDNIFDPFFTTKEVGKGTGLGLSMVYGVVQSHHGAIEVESEVGTGTAFHVYLPLEQTESTALSLDEQAIDIPCGNGETILLVDDEEIVRTSAAALLSHLGYRVITASNGKQALDMDNLASIDLALLDIVMPEMGGVEAAEHLRRIQPNLPVIFATAYDRTHVAAGSERLVNSRLISKPFRINYLGRAIHQMITIHDAP